MSESKKIGRSVRYTFVYWFIRFLIWISNSLSRRSWLGVCGFLGSLAYPFARKTRKLTIRHLGIAFPDRSGTEIRRLARRVFVMLGKNAGDILRSTRIRSLDELEKILVTEGLENFEVAQARGQGVIFLTCHLGAFDLQVTNMAMRGLNPNIIGTPLKNRRLNELLWQYRNAHGAIAIARGKETFKLIKALKSGGSVALLIDQDTRVQTVFVNFFGRKAATPVGATVLAMKTGAAVIPTFIHLGEDGRQHMHILPEIPMRVSGDEQRDIVFNTQVLTNFIEEQIRKYPDQWVWMHERWKTRPADERAPGLTAIS